MAKRDDYDGDRQPRRGGARVATLTLVLAVLNIFASLGFGYLALLDYQKRQEWSFAVFMHDLVRQGLPSTQEEKMLTAWQVTATKEKLTPEQIKEVFLKRGGSGSGEFITVNDVVASRIKPEHLSDEVLSALFSGLGPPVKTIEDEAKRLKMQVLGDIASSAEKLAKATDDKTKAQKIGDLLFPLCYTGKQVETLDAKIKQKGANLEALLNEAAQRSLIMQMLTPLEGFRPGDFQNAIVENAADLEQVKLEKLREVVERRFDQAAADKFDPEVHQGKEWENELRDSFERRSYAAFLFLAASQMELDGVPLYPKGLERTTVVAGLIEIIPAIQNYETALDVERDKVISAIKIDREGYTVASAPGKVGHAPGFVSSHEGEVKQLQEIKESIDNVSNRLETMRIQQADAKKHYEERVQQKEQAVAKLKAARAETDRLLTDLRRLQEELFQAQLELANAPERNVELMDQLRRKSEQGLQTP